VTGFLHYNKTNFAGTPRVIVGMKSYGMLPLTAFTALNTGFRFNITSRNATNLTFTVTTFGVTVVALHYQYLAVLGYDNLYYMQFYTIYRNPHLTQSTHLIPCSTAQSQGCDQTLSHYPILLVWSLMPTTLQVR
jgi:hypothetical protein